ncbi:Tfp pilus assembly protein PilW, disrupted [Deinococcus geothermalis DSM 11300]|uniref:Tfp pilus assembly protein PilW, disrupted n=1 Tax=Deinococcus geothermalis (strain DSM 11300 / CIP 105573 / AG-3a) TaxID=319795 RepID=Q1IWI1_DEIGD|nr:type II secretion system protein [Deinococcus geothermalis]ABF46403.1 Tfp pilus assembly protein PilW, disrupted [Deinococcus geothermalis DSM 11300]
MRGKQSGFTLLEMLVVIALLGIVMTALASTFMSGSQATTLALSRAELQQETVNAEQLIASRVKEAYYVFPPGQTLVLGSSSANLRTNPLTGKTTWTVGTHPILALILPPRNPALTCTASTNDGCYRFFAYYPVKRSVWVAGSSGAANPGDDAANGESWVFSGVAPE